MPDVDVGAEVDILLPMFNGAKYLLELLDSLYQQSYENFQLLIRDDASLDNSCEILKKHNLLSKVGVRIFYNDENIGVVSNVNYLLSDSHAPYIMFADQDDVWFPNKVSKSLFEIKKAEKKYGSDMPIVVFSDAYVGDEDLVKQSGSLLDRNGYFGYGSSSVGVLFKHLMVQNVVSGCTMMMNASMKKCLMPIPREAIMHDWWMMLVASSMGRVIFIPERTMIYRLHQNNTVGLRQSSFFIGLLHVIKKPLQARQRVRKTYGQAEIFKNRYAKILENNFGESLDAYISLSGLGFFQRCWVLWRNKFKKSALSKTIGLYFLS
ncbi:MAG: glycosyltransferase family 2 protein [Gammaproteobacteria bacterium]|nr:glycosyltransferase family 2 protein [Gammaproteobacteria bacterium]